MKRLAANGGFLSDDYCREQAHNFCFESEACRSRESRCLLEHENEFFGAGFKFGDFLV